MTANCLLILVYHFLILRVRYAVEDFKKSLSNLCFLIKFSYVPYTRKPFTWKVMLAVLSLFILFPTVFCVTLWSSFAFVCTYHTILFLSLLTTKSDMFLLGLEKADISDGSGFLKDTRSKILFLL